MDAGLHSATMRCGSDAYWCNFFPASLKYRGLLALIKLQASRTAARRRRKGEAVLFGVRTALCGTTRRFSEEWPRSKMRKSWVEAQAYMLCLGAIAA
jgi:hypothetical protein